MVVDKLAQPFWPLLEEKVEAQPALHPQAPAFEDFVAVDACARRRGIVFGRVVPADPHGVRPDGLATEPRPGVRGVRDLQLDSVGGAETPPLRDGFHQNGTFSSPSSVLRDEDFFAGAFSGSGSSKRVG